MNNTYDFSKISRMPHPLLRKKYAKSISGSFSGGSRTNTEALWTAVGDTLLAGSLEEIAALRCPDCGGPITSEYNQGTSYMNIACSDCGGGKKYFLGNAVPNCIRSQSHENGECLQDTHFGNASRVSLSVEINKLS